MFQRIDELDRREEADTAPLLLDRLDADRRRQMRLPGPGAADEDDIVRLGLASSVIRPRSTFDCPSMQFQQLAISHPTESTCSVFR
jgi:hypothetical protein